MWTIKTDFGSFLEMEKWEKRWRHVHGKSIVRVFLPNVPYALAYYDKNLLSDLYDQIKADVVRVENMQKYIREHPDMDWDKGMMVDSILGTHDFE